MDERMRAANLHPGTIACFSRWLPEEIRNMTNEELRRLLKTDLYDGAPWSDVDIRDLKAGVGRGRPIEEVARMLCRSGSTSEVRSKAAELGLRVVR